MINPFRVLLAPAVFLIAASSHAEHTVAHDDLGEAGKSAHLVSGATWEWPDSVPASVTDRNIAFGKHVSLCYGGVDPKATYAAEITLSSDNQHRTAAVSIDGVQVGGDIAIKPNSERMVTVEIPVEALADGKFELAIHNVDGASPNAAVSSVTIRSSSPGALKPALPVTNLGEIRFTPMPVSRKLGPQWTRSLNGTWKFAPRAPADFSTSTPGSGWEDIQVPGQWRNQGHDVPAEQDVAYFRAFSIPADWNGRLIKLRFDAVFSDCEVFVNGHSIGSHSGGFTSFECDITKAAMQGENTLALRVTSWSLADQMASASKYACHPLGGISRDVTLFSVPPLHVSDLFVRTEFDDAYRDAVLRIDMEIDACSADGPGRMPVSFRLWAPDRREVDLVRPKRDISWQKPGMIAGELEFPVPAARWWTPETPDLYLLEIRAGEHVIRQEVGFREVSVTSSGIFVNGRPVKLRGISAMKPIRCGDAACRRDNGKRISSSFATPISTSFGPATIRRPFTSGTRPIATACGLRSRAPSAGKRDPATRPTGTSRCGSSPRWSKHGATIRPSSFGPLPTNRPGGPTSRLRPGSCGISTRPGRRRSTG